MIIYIIFIVVGGLLLAYALAALKSRLALVKGGEKAVGTVVELIKEKDDDGTFYYPVFEIRTRQQEIITYTSSTGTSFASRKTGETAVFIIESGKPDTVRVLSYWAIFGWSLSLMAVAVDLLIIGAGYFLLHGWFGA